MTQKEAKIKFRLLVLGVVTSIGDRFIFGLPLEGFTTPFITGYNLTVGLNDTHNDPVTLQDLVLQLSLIAVSERECQEILDQLITLHNHKDVDFERIALSPGPCFHESDYNRHHQVVTSVLSFS